MTFKVFTNDVGPNQYSAFKRIEAASQDEADERAAKLTQMLPTDPRRNDQTLRVLAILETRTDMMPDGQTGRLPKTFNGTILTKFGGARPGARWTFLRFDGNRDARRRQRR